MNDEMADRRRGICKNCGRPIAWSSGPMFGFWYHTKSGVAACPDAGRKVAEPR